MAAGSGRVGVLTFSEGPEALYRALAATCLASQDRLVKALEGEGYQVLSAGEVVWARQGAVQGARRLTEAGCQVTVFNFPGVASCQLPVLAAGFAPKPILLFSSAGARHPGLPSLLACAGSLSRIGVRHARAWGDIVDPQVRRRVRSFLDAGICANTLRGQTLGLFGGKGTGTLAPAADADQWLREFGVRIEQAEQLEVVRRAGEVPAGQVEEALAWWRENAGQIHYDETQLTEEILKRQLACYLTMKGMCAERGFDFCAIGRPPEATENWCATELAATLLNDAYDHEGAKELVACATDADEDGALTMQIFKLLAGKPVLCTEIRHWNAELGIFDLCSPGGQATYFAGASLDPKQNLRSVELYPAGAYAGAGGATAHHLAATGRVTLGRLTRHQDQYWLRIATGEFVRFDGRTNERLMRESTYEWPHAFWRPDFQAEELLDTYVSKHIHGTYGDLVEPLLDVADILGLETMILGG